VCRVSCRVCRVSCRVVVRDIKKAAVVDCCTAAECVAKAKLACVRGLSCSHPCGGIAGEALCPPCLHIDCAREGTSFPTLPRAPSLLPLTLACAACVRVCGRRHANGERSLPHLLCGGVARGPVRAVELRPLLPFRMRQKQSLQRLVG
jgi:hypothetical protein